MMRDTSLVRCSLFVVRCSLFVVRCSLVFSLGSLAFVFRAVCRLLLPPAVRCPLLAIRYQLQTTKTTVAALVINDRFQQMDASEVGPERFGNIDLAVSSLPQKKV